MKLNSSIMTHVTLRGTGRVSLPTTLPSKNQSIRLFHECKDPQIIRSCLFERNETRRVGGADTGTTVLDGVAAAVVSYLESRPSHI